MEFNEVIEKLKQTNEDTIRLSADGRRLDFNVKVHKTISMDDFMSVAQTMYNSHSSLPSRLIAFYVSLLHFYTDIDTTSVPLEDVVLLIWRTDIIYRLQEILGIAFDDLKTIVLSTDDATVINENDITSTLQMVQAMGELDQSDLAKSLVEYFNGTGKNE